MKELDGLYAEFMGRTPPAKGMAMLCRFDQGWLFLGAGKLDQAETTVAEACELLPHDQPFEWWRHRAPALYVRVLSARGKLTQAVKIARDSLKTPPNPNAVGWGGQVSNWEAWGGYVWLVGELSGALCGQDDFAEATAMLGEQSSLVAEGGGSKQDLVRMEALRGAVQARAGNASNALAILETVATNQLSNPSDWAGAINLALAAGDRVAYRRLCGIVLLRFASTAEEKAAEQAAWHLLNGPTDETTLGIAKAMVERLDRAQNSSKELIDWLRALAAYREHRYQEGLDFLDRFRNASLSPINIAVREAPYNRAHIAFLRAMLGAELGRVEDARKDFAEGRKQQKLARGDKPVQDRGEKWWETYGTEIVQREAIEVFKAKGIPLPAPDAK